MACDPSMTTGNGGPPNPVCDMCVRTMCNAQLTACFGPSWQAGTIAGSICEGFFACVCACAPGNPTCAVGCYQSASPACTSCLTTAGQCTGTACQTQCETMGTGGTGGGGMSGGGGSSGGSGCAGLSACCASLSGSAAQSCNTILMAAAGNDQSCMGVLDSYRQTGMCR
jgi:hypothetical protein